jgi:predicted rRNA methylase YqxC with S4 and FtsJ domains
VQVGKGGIVKDPIVHQEVGDILLSELLEYCQFVKKKISRTLIRNFYEVKMRLISSTMQVLEKITKGLESFGFCSKGWIESPLKGAEGNTEFLVHFSRIHNKCLKS